MRIKKILTATAVSLVIMLLIMNFTYNFQVNMNTVSNVLFLTGLIFFFPGIATISGSGKLYRSFGYAFDKVVWKKDYENFEKYNQYKKMKREKGKGYSITAIGVVYLCISITLGMIA